MAERVKDRQEFGIFVERFMHLMNLWTVYSDFLTKRYVPSVGVSYPTEEWQFPDMGSTLMFMLYAFFYSLIEDSDEGLNGFRVWRVRFPEEESAIAAVEAQVIPFSKKLKLFRNRLGFHGSRSRAHEARGLELFLMHSGSEIWEAIKNFKSLGSALLAKENARQGLQGYDPDRVRRWIDAVAARARHATQARKADSL
jgi:hypothetical protein